jgi:hypothetical protein
MGFPPVYPSGIYLLCELVELVPHSLNWSHYSQRVAEPYSTLDVL